MVTVASVMPLVATPVAAAAGWRVGAPLMTLPYARMRWWRRRRRCYVLPASTATPRHPVRVQQRPRLAAALHLLSDDRPVRTAGGGHGERGGIQVCTACRRMRRVKSLLFSSEPGLHCSTRCRRGNPFQPRQGGIPRHQWATHAVQEWALQMPARTGVTMSRHASSTRFFGTWTDKANCAATRVQFGVMLMIG